MTMSGMVAHMPVVLVGGTQSAEEEGLRVQGLLGLCSKTVS